MKLALISHISSEGPEKLLGNLEKNLSALGTTPDLICGPDYGLAVHYCTKPNSQQERQAILKRIKDISKNFPSTAMLLGTMPWTDKENMYLSGQLYKAGKIQGEFFKQRDNGEFKLARTVGKTYFPGQSIKNKLLIGDKEVCYEICGDHGNQLVDGCFLELIPALDVNGGFYLSALNNGWRHHGAITNGINGKTACFTLDPKSTQRIVEVQPDQMKGGIKIYNLK